ncbi:MAG: site-specific DNA-methyltransferase [Eggerthia catenaformis]|uniref:site-specific DNA-methyltransferase n=1 Tax=Eggerthia catenaformis TaxID=31973 RepID=UPI003FA082E4
MDKMKMESTDITAQNIDFIGSRFSDCVTESVDNNGQIKKSIDFNILHQMLSNDVVDGAEAYELTWVGKKKSIIEANQPIRKTLRPSKEESVNWDTTKNLYIEGDNLEVLKLLQESYLGKIKMIYIDPPYNTGNDILYKNDYSSTKDEYDNEISVDEDGNYLFTNTETNGRFHSDWLSMMYSRIRLARNLMSDDGFFAIAIDHNELFNLGVICDEIFGFKNRIGVISVVHKPEGRNQAKYIGPSNEFMLLYIKDESKAKIRKVAIDDEQVALFDMGDDKGAYRLKKFIRLADGKYSTREAKPDFWYPIYVSTDLNKLSVEQFENSTPVFPITETGVERTWKTSRETCAERISGGDIIAKKENEKLVVYEKLREDQVIKTHWINKKYHGFHFGTKILDDLLGVKTFDFPKSLYLMHDIFKLFTEKDDIILDFFSGSATSAHAIMQLNSEDLNNRRFILAQIPASCDEKSDAYKAGYKNICEIGKERIRRAGQKIIEENPTISEKIDVGFRVFKVDDSNMNDVYYSAGEYSQDLLSMMESNVKSDRTDLDLLFGCLLEWGLPLSLPYSSEIIDGFAVHTYNDGDLIACFDENISEEVIKTIAKRQPLRAVFRDNSFANSPAKINIGEIFKLLAPDTRVKVI